MRCWEVQELGMCECGGLGGGCSVGMRILLLCSIISRWREVETTLIPKITRKSE